MTQPKIDRFFGKYRWLSNFWPVEVWFENMLFTTVEHAYQAAKTFDLEWRRRIAACEKPGQAKRLARKMPLRPDWEGVKINIMYSLLKQKFERGSDLAKRLIGTGDEELVEGNTWGDVFWGVCDGKGENMLGKLLMRVREEL